jgi:surfactin synthase thioesterase subunit
MNRINLICLPFVGGSKYSYRGYVNCAPDNIDVIPVELPGRGTRYKEPLLKNVHLMIDDIFSQVKEKLSSPYIIYGHSMGTLLGYLLTKLIVKKGLPQPECLFFTGCSGPSFRNDEPPTHLLPREELFEKIKSMEGSPDEILNDIDLMIFFEPIIRADFQAIETYVYQNSDPFTIPITVITGIEEKITREQVETWQLETTKPVEIFQLPGKHFFIFQHEEKIMNLIANKTASKILI